MLVGRVGRAQCLAGRSRLQMRMHITMTILVVLALPSPDGDCPHFESPVAGSGDRSCSVVEEARAFHGAFLTGVHRRMQVRKDDMKQQHTKAQ